MEKAIQGIVKQNPVLFDKCCMFAVEQDGELYLVVSTGKQAQKDDVFVEQGQEISIMGGCMESNRFKGVIVSRKAEIILNKCFKYV